MWRTIFTGAIATYCVLVLQPGIANAQLSFGSTSNFSTTLNTETSTWSYRYEEGNTPNGIYPLLPTYGPANGNWSSVNPGAWNTGDSGLPEIGVNRTGVTVTNQTTSPGDNFSIANSYMFMRSVAGKMAVISWLFPLDTPQSVTYSYAYDVMSQKDGDGYTLYHEVRQADGTLVSQAYDLGLPFARGQGSGSAIMGPGDRLNFLVSSASSPTATSWTDSFDAIRMLPILVKVVPEPASVVLFASGMLGLAVIRLRGKFRAQD